MPSNSGEGSEALLRVAEPHRVPSGWLSTLETVAIETPGFWRPPK